MLESLMLPNPTFTVSGRSLKIFYEISATDANKILNSKLAIGVSEGLLVSGRSGAPFLGYFSATTVYGSLLGTERKYGGCGVPENSSEIGWGGIIRASLEYILEDGGWIITVSQMNSGDPQAVEYLDKDTGIIYYLT